MKKLKAYHTYAPTALFFLTIITYLSCHKAEPMHVALDTTSAAFFQVPKNTVPAVSTIIQSMNRLNDRSPFAQTMVHNAGKPQWAFAKIKSNSTTRGPADEQIINIPFVKEGQFKTTAILSVVITGADTSYDLFYPQNYLRYAMGDDTMNASQKTAKDFFSVFAGFDHDLFGTTDYCVNDGRIFGFGKEDKLEVTISYPGETNARQAAGSAPNMAAADYIQVCKTIKACVYANARSSTARVLGTCTSSVQCAYVWNEEGGTQPPSTTPSGGGGSGKPVAGGGGGTGGMTVAPCARSMNANGRELIASDPCGQPWDPSFIVAFVPCKSSFNFVVQGNWQSAVITDYKFSLYDQGTRKTFPIDIGMIEVGMPSKTYTNSIISTRTAQAIAAQAAALAEYEVTTVLNAQIIVNPNGSIDNQYYKTMFKDAYKLQIDLLLQADYYNGQNVYPSTIGYDSRSFSLKDLSQYKTLRFYGKDCF